MKNSECTAVNATLFNRQPYKHQITKKTSLTLSCKSDLVIGPVFTKSNLSAPLASETLNKHSTEKIYLIRYDATRPCEIRQHKLCVTNASASVNFPVFTNSHKHYYERLQIMDLSVAQRPTTEARDHRHVFVRRLGTCHSRHMRFAYILSFIARNSGKHHMRPSNTVR